MKRSEMPVFGNMQDIKVLLNGQSLACPFAGTLFAEQGADVIMLESPVAPDMYRSFGGGWSADRRNHRTMTLDIPSPEGRVILTELLKKSDVLIESSRGGTWDKWNLSDEELWKINPGLVIAHVSGYGQTGDPGYVKRGSFDPIGQAFSGFMAINGEPDPAPPYAAKPFTCDYITALFTAWSVTAALVRKAKTGLGESIDLSQFEVLARLQGNFLMEGINNLNQPPRMGNKDLRAALENVQKCKDGNWVMLALGGIAVMQKVDKLWGLDKDPDFAEPHAVVFKTDGPRAEKFVKAAVDFCQSHTAEEVETILCEQGIPCSRIMTYPMMLEDPQYKAREVITEWFDVTTDKVVKGVNTIPKFKKNPSRIVRGGPGYGMDNDDILGELGLGETEIQNLYDKKIITKKAK